MKYSKLLFVFIYVLFSFIQIVNAQVTTSVNKQKIPLNDELLVTYNYSGNSRVMRVGNVQFKHFGVNGPLTESINNNGKIDYSITYILKPTQEGTFTIPGIQIETADGKLYQSKSVIVEITKAQKSTNNSLPQNRPRQSNSIEAELIYLESQLEMIQMMMANPFLTDNEYKRLEKYYKDLEKAIKDLRNNRGKGSNSPTTIEEGIGQLKDNFFLKAEPSKKVVYKGEAIELIYKLYYTTPFSGGSIGKLPQLKDFNSRDFEMQAEPKPYRANYNGREYMVLDLKKSIIYPTKIGELSIDDMQLSAYTERYGRVTIGSDEVKIQVKDLPTVESSSFTGGVGEFAITNNIQTTQFTTDDVISLNVIISGKGNLEILNQPYLENVPNNIYLTQTSSNINYDEKSLTKGEKIFNYQISVTQPGIYIIPEIPFTYFDTKKNEYVTLKSEPIKIEVTEGTKLVRNNSQSEKDNLEIDYYKGKLPERTIERNWFKSPIFWSISALFVALVPLFLGVRDKKRQVNKNAINNSAEKVAKQRLKMASKLVQDDPKNQFYEEISKAIYLYLSQKLNIQLSDLNKNILKEKLIEKGIDEQRLNQVINLIQESEYALYAANWGGFDKTNMLKQATELITYFETIEF